MARMPRVVVPDYPHHVTQRGNRCQRTFFSGGDYRKYLKLLSEARREADADIWAYCLMPNHVHLIVVPSEPDSLARLFRNSHRRYSGYINLRQGWRGHLWQERFHSCVMDECHLISAVRYVELNPVRASLCKRPEDWPWSSVHAHITGLDDGLVSVAPLLSRIGNWLEYLSMESDDERIHAIRRHTRTGRPAGGDKFLTQLEATSGRQLRKAKPGPKRVK